MLDTYFDKTKNNNIPIINDRNDSIKKVESTEEEIIVPKIKSHIIENQTTTQSQGVPEFNISDTAINEYFSVVTSEYQIERSKKQSFETRSGLLITLLSAICIFYFQSIKLTDIIALCNKPLTFLLLSKYFRYYNILVFHIHIYLYN